jgi:hypothetical protein
MIQTVIYEKIYIFNKKISSQVCRVANLLMSLSTQDYDSLDESIEARTVSTEMPKQSNGLRIRKFNYDQPTEQIKQQLNY